MGKTFTAIGIIILICVAALATYSYLSKPSFLIINHTTKDIDEIKILWRDNSKTIKGLKTGQNIKTYIRSEAAAKFIVIFADSKSIESKAIYFTSGTKIIADIFDNKVDVRYDFKERNKKNLP